jgi:hypothetical protein
MNKTRTTNHAHGDKARRTTAPGDDDTTLTEAFYPIDQARDLVWEIRSEYRYHNNVDLETAAFLSRCADVLDKLLDCNAERVDLWERFDRVEENYAAIVDTHRYAEESVMLLRDNLADFAEHVAQWNASDYDTVADCKRMAEDYIATFRDNVDGIGS